MGSKLFAEAGIFSDVKISQVFWFKTQWGKDLLKIQMATESDARKVLGLKNTLRFREEYKKVFITADRSPQERRPKMREKTGGFITYRIPQQSTTSQLTQTQPNTYYPVPQPHPFPPYPTPAPVQNFVSQRFEPVRNFFLRPRGFVV